MQTIKSSKVRGNRIKRLVFVFLDSKTVNYTVKKTRALKFGLMEATTAVVLAKELNRGSAFTSGPMARGMRVNGSRMKCLARVLSIGQMDAISKVSSKMA